MRQAYYDKLRGKAKTIYQAARARANRTLAEELAAIQIVERMEAEEEQEQGDEPPARRAAKRDD